LEAVPPLLLKSQKKQNSMHKILIVEDTVAIREEIFDILVMENYTVFQAENGEIGFEVALKEGPDLIISDILMPDLNGIEMFKKLQTNKKTIGIPLIFLSAKGEKEDIRNGMNLGAEDYLTKPINVNDLLNAVESKIKKKIIVDQKIIDRTITLSAILQIQRDELDNYAHLISHELKSSLRNVSDLLAWSQEELKETNNLGDSTNTIQLMGEKVEKMELLLVKLEQYKNITNTTFKDTVISSNSIAKQVINEIHTPAHITIKIKNELPVLFADESMLKKIFEILIQNALDHIDKKSGFIELECKTTEKDHVFSVKDNGIGIHPKYHKKIFKMFQVIESNKSTGTGLSIVEKIISHYNGKIYVESIPNIETTFYFNLPKTKNNE
jgi:two-component system sensor histidine kinase/response regulator